MIFSAREEPTTRFTVKIKPRFGECNTCFGCEAKPGVDRILVIFQDRPMLSHIIQTALRELSIDAAEHRYMLTIK